MAASRITLGDARGMTAHPHIEVDARGLHRQSNDPHPSVCHPLYEQSSICIPPRLLSFSRLSFSSNSSLPFIQNRIIHCINCHLRVKPMPFQKSHPERRWSMWPTLHQDVLRLLDEEEISFDFHEADTVKNQTKWYDTSIMGRFSCSNKSCSTKAWSSKKIAITIRLYPKERYNARVYHQRCNSCNQLGMPELDDDSYAERVAYRLKKWSGIELDSRPAFLGHSKGPHQSKLCEGCKAGHCKDGDDLARISEGIAEMNLRGA